MTNLINSGSPTIMLLKAVPLELNTRHCVSPLGRSGIHTADKLQTVAITNVDDKTGIQHQTPLHMFWRDSGGVLVEKSSDGTLFIIRGHLSYYLLFLWCLSIVSLLFLSYHQSLQSLPHTHPTLWAHAWLEMSWNDLFSEGLLRGMSHLVLESNKPVKSFQMSLAKPVQLCIASIFCSFDA